MDFGYMTSETDPSGMGAAFAPTLLGGSESGQHGPSENSSGQNSLNKNGSQGNGPATTSGGFGSTAGTQQKGPGVQGLPGNSIATTNGTTVKGATATNKTGREGEGAEATGAHGTVPQSPDGYIFEFAAEVQVDEQALAAFKDVAFEQGISQQQAATIANLYASLVEQQAEGEQAALAESEEGWLKELRQGRNYAKTVASARLAMERFGTPELNDLLNETRLGSHPALVRFVAKIGQELGEPLFMRGKGPGRTEKLNFYETMEG